MSSRNGHNGKDGRPKNSFSSYEKALASATRRRETEGKRLEPYLCYRRTHYHLRTIRTLPPTKRAHDDYLELADRVAGCLSQENTRGAQLRIYRLTQRMRAAKKYAWRKIDRQTGRAA